MATYNLGIRQITLAGVIAVALLWVMSGKGLAQEKEATWKEVADAGKPTYEQYCAVCHGREGKGDGGAANLLTVKPADLTQISKKSGGTYPFWRIYRIIDGREAVKGHGTSDMPIWGTEFRPEAGRGAASPSLVRGRILELVYYLEYIQAR